MKPFLGHNSWLLCLLALSISACGSPSAPQTIGCNLSEVGSSCSASSGGEIVNIDWSQIAPKQEYALVLVNKDSATARFNLSTDVSPGITPREEKEISQQISHLNAPIDGTSLPGWDGVRPPQALANLISDDEDLSERASFNANEMALTARPAEGIFVDPLQDLKLVPTPKFYETLGGMRNVFKVFGEKDPLGYTSKTQRAAAFKNSELMKCLSEVLPKTMKWLGEPVDVDGVKEVSVVINSSIKSSTGSAIGLFSSTDRFTHANGKPLHASNGGEILYITPGEETEIQCSTTAHEYTHLMRFDATVLKKLGHDPDLNTANQSGLRGEVPAFDEGYAHIVEQLTDKKSVTLFNILKFLREPNNATLDLTRAAEVGIDHARRTRGFATLLIYHAIALKGGQLTSEDPITRDLIKLLTQSPDIGLANIASAVGMNEHDFLNSFFKNWLSSFYSGENTFAFIPPTRSTLEGERGLQILSPSLAYASYSLSDGQASRSGYAKFHPYQMKLPYMSIMKSAAVDGKSIAIYRWSTFENKRQGKIKITSTSSSPYEAFFVRMK